VRSSGSTVTCDTNLDTKNPTTPLRRFAAEPFAVPSGTLGLSANAYDRKEIGDIEHNRETPPRADRSFRRAIPMSSLANCH
jgi:hypothetical protein